MKKLKPAIYIRNFIVALMFSYMTPLLSSAQDGKAESFWMHFDKPFYLTGETIWFKIYQTDFNLHEDHSNVVYVNIHNKKGELIEQEKLQLTEGASNGSFDVPVSWSEDYYYFSCFTKWNLQFEKDNFYLKEIPIYNGFFTGNATTTQSKSIFTENSGQIQISLDKNEYQRRERIKIKLGGEGDCSISIVSGDCLPETSLGNGYSASVIKYQPHHVKEKEKSLTLEGTINDITSGTTIQSDVLCLYESGCDQFVRLATTDGQVKSERGFFSGSKTFQLFNMNPFQSESPDFKVFIAGEKLDGLPENSHIPPRTEFIVNYIKNQQLNTKITEIFEEQKIDSLQAKIFSPIPFKADKVYDMKKFKALKTLEDFLREIVMVTDLITEKGVTSVKMKNMETRNYFMDSPWYLVDGYLTKDETKVLKIPFVNLVRVEIYNTNNSILGQLDPVMIRSGLIAIYTDDLAFKDKISKRNLFEFHGLSKQSKYPAVDQLPLQKARQNPELNPVLYWNPNLKLQGETEITINSSDLIGEFMIEVHGYNKDGQKLYGSKPLSVKY